MRTAQREQHCRATWCPCTRKASDVRSYHTIRNHGAKNTKPKNLGGGGSGGAVLTPHYPLPAAVGQLGATGGGRAPGTIAGRRGRGRFPPLASTAPSATTK